MFTMGIVKYKSGENYALSNKSIGVIREQQQQQVK